MLSRFDLIFILMDRPDDAMDMCVSEHVLAMHSGQVRNRPALMISARLLTSGHLNRPTRC